MTRPRKLGLLLAFAALCASLPCDAQPPATSKEGCVDAYGKAQRFRRRGELLAARDQLLICSQQECPAALRDDCVPWLTQVDDSLPSVVIQVRDAAGQDLRTIRVTVDGTLRLEHLDGKAITLDPGEHTFRIEAADGYASEQRLLVHEGERARRIVVELPPAPAASSSPTAAPIQPPPIASHAPLVVTRVPPPAEAPTPVSAWVLGGVGAAAFGGFAWFGLSGWSKQRQLEADCAPACAPDEVDTMRDRYRIADICLGVAVLSGAAATWLVLSDPAPNDGSAAAVQLSPMPKGGAASVWLAF